MTQSDAVLTERRGRVLLITINRPEAMNAINSAVSKGISEAAERLDDDPELAAGVLAGTGRAFCAGMDLKAFARGEKIGTIDDFLRQGTVKPLIAAIDGIAFAGGLELALACDLIVAGEGSRLGIPEVAVGLFAAGGALMRLPRRIGYGKAMEMALTGDPIASEEAERVGLVDRLAPAGKAVNAALEIAERIARNAPLSIAASKHLIRISEGLTDDDFWAAQHPLQHQVFRSTDAKEGARAFAEKRPPEWTGH